MRITYIDGLKGLACLTVLVFHVNATFVVEDVLVRQLPTPFHLLTNGTWAVFFFLLLSGFSVSQALMSRHDYQGTIVKRYFRLSLPLAVVQLLVFLMGVSGCFFTTEVSSLTQDPWIGDFYTSFKVSALLKGIFFTVPGGAEYALSYIPPGWMMSYIFWGTFLVIILQLGTENLARKKRFMVYFLCILVFWHMKQLLAVAVGAMISQSYQDLQKLRQLRYGIWISWVLLIVSVLSYVIKEKYVLSTSLMLVFVIMNGHAQRCLNLKPVQALGKISLWVYLLHWPIMCSLGSLVFIQMFPAHPGLAYYESLAVCLFLTIGFSYMATKYLSPLLQRLTNRITSFILS